MLNHREENGQWYSVTGRNSRAEKTPQSLALLETLVNSGLLDTVIVSHT